MTPTLTNTERFAFGFRAFGKDAPRRLTVAARAFAGHADCDPRCELERECYLSAFRFGDDFRDHLARTGSTKCYGGPCWADWIWFDIDRDGNLAAALDAARRLVVTLADVAGIADADTLAFFSGAKGFHVGAATSAWLPEGGSNFHCIARRFAEAVAERAGIAIDTVVYDKVRLFRAPNSRHPKTGLHKRRLAVDELMHLSPDAIVTLAGSPAPFDVPTPTRRSERAAALWADAAEHVRADAEALKARRAAGDGPGRLNRATLDYIRDGAPPGDPSATGNPLSGRHNRLYSAAANIAEFGATLPLCIALLTEAALDTGLPPTDVRRGIECGWASIQGKGTA